MRISSPTRRAGPRSSSTRAHRWSRCTRLPSAGTCVPSTSSARTATPITSLTRPSSACTVVTRSLDTGGLHIEALPTPGPLRRPPRLRRQRRALLLGGHPLQGRRRRRARRAGDQALGDGSRDGAAARAARAPRPHRRDHDRPGVGGEPVRALLARASTTRWASPCRVGGDEATSSSTRPTTTARASCSSGSPTAVRRSSAAHGWSAASSPRNEHSPAKRADFPAKPTTKNDDSRRRQPPASGETTAKGGTPVAAETKTVAAATRGLPESPG